MTLLFSKDYSPNFSSVVKKCMMDLALRPLLLAATETTPLTNFLASAEDTKQML